MNEVGERLEALEVKAAYAEDLLEKLNLTIYQQSQEIDRLRVHVARLRQQLRDSASPGAGQRDPRDEIPPHY